MPRERVTDEPPSLQRGRLPTVAVHTALFRQAPLLAGFQRDPMQALCRLFVAFSKFARLVVGGKDHLSLCSQLVPNPSP
jgi:hypothetical protein